MEINEMNLSEVVERLSQLDEEVRAMEDVAEVEKATELKNSLLKRKAELEEIETRKQNAENIEKNKVSAEEITVLEERQEEEKNMEKTYEVNSAEYRSAWAHTLQGVATDEEQRAYALAGAVVPTEVSDKFFEKLKKLAPMVNEITLLKVAGNVKFAVEGDRAAAAKHTENASISGAEDTMVTVSLGAFEFAKLISISKAVSAMAVSAFEDWLVLLLSGDIARAIDNYILNDGTNGLAANTSIEVITCTTDYTYANIMSLIGKLPAAYDSEAKFLVNKKVLFEKVKNICDTSKRPIFDPVDKTLCGYPVIVDDHVTATKNPIYLGRWTDIVGNLSQDIQVEADAHSGFRYGSIDYRGFACFDSKVAKTDGIVKMVISA